MTRKEAIKEVGIGKVEAVESLNCDHTNRVTNDDTYEFCASVSCIADDYDYTLTAYYYQPKNAVNNNEDLGTLNWEVSHYSID